VVKIANIKGGNLVMDGCSFVPQAIADSAAEFTLQAGDILIAMTGYIGDVAIVRERDLPAVLNQRVGRLSIRDPLRLDPRFLFYVLRDDDVRKKIEGLAYGSAQRNVSPSLIHSVEIPLPPLDEQHEIARMLQAVDAKIAAEHAHRAALEEVFKTLLHQLMTGKVRVKSFHLPDLEWTP
jgi:type I restriction enzyme S subunit